MKKETIIEIVCNHFNTTFASIYATRKSRKIYLIKVRSFIYLFLKQNTNLSLEMIGKVFEQDHATVSAALKKINGWIETDSNLMASYLEISSLIENPDYVKMSIEKIEAEIQKQSDRLNKLIVTYRKKLKQWK